MNLSEIRRNLADLGKVLLPTECVGCGAWDEEICDECLGKMLGKPFALPPLGKTKVPLYALARYDGPMRRIMVTGKHDTRRDLRPYFQAAGQSMVQVLVQETAQNGAGEVPQGQSWEEIFVVPAPSTHPRSPSPVADAFAQGIASGLVQSGKSSRAAVLEILELSAGSTTQSGLGWEARNLNRHGKMRLRGDTETTRKELSSSALVLVDDVTATGATLKEMLRVLQGCGAPVLGGLVFASAHREDSEREAE